MLTKGISYIFKSFFSKDVLLVLSIVMDQMMVFLSSGTLPPFSVFQLFYATSCASFCLSCVGCLIAIRSVGHWSCCFFGLFGCLFISFLLCCLGFNLLLGKTLVSEFVLAPLFSAVPYLDYYSASTALVVFKWLLFSSEDINEFALLCVLLTFLTSSYSPLRGPGHLFDTFFTFCNYFSIVLVWFGFNIVGKPTIFSFIRSFTSSRF